MDKWLEILMAVENMWEIDSYAQYLTTIGCDPQKYCIERDTFKADRIYALYGYDYFLRFVERCPHIQEMAQKYLPCERSQDAQCTMFCINYKGGCKNATE